MRFISSTFTDDYSTTTCARMLSCHYPQSDRQPGAQEMKSNNADGFLPQPSRSSNAVIILSAMACSAYYQHLQ